MVSLPGVSVLEAHGSQSCLQPLSPWHQNVMNMHDFLPEGPRHKVTQGALRGSSKDNFNAVVYLFINLVPQNARDVHEVFRRDPSPDSLPPSVPLSFSPGLLQQLKSVPLLFPLLCCLLFPKQWPMGLKHKSDFFLFYSKLTSRFTFPWGKTEMIDILHVQYELTE